MVNYYYIVSFFCLYFNILKADISNKDPTNVEFLLSKTGGGHISPFPEECSKILKEFADYASNFTRCSILNARPIRICEQCISHYISFHNKYQELLNTVVNGTSCKSIFISHDRLDVVLEYHNNILNIWNKGQCYACYNWSNTVPVLSNETIHFYEKYNETIKCIKKYINGPPINDSQVVCDNCMQSYLQLDSYYKTLSEDSIGVDSICMDIVDSMNATRSIWSKTLNCCKIRRTPEIIFLCCTGIISALPLFYYIILRYCGPMRELPNVLKQSRFKQTILRSLGRTN